MKKWLIIRYNNNDYKEKVFKTFDNEAEAIKYFDNLTLNKPMEHFKKFSYELHDCFGEIINATI